MNKILALTVTALLSSTLTPAAHADRGHRHGHRGYWQPPVVVERHHHDHWRPRHWVGPAAVLAITGAAIGAGAYHYYNQPAPVYVPPARSYPPAQPANTWYYCGSSGQYYPYTNACPEGWQAVPAR